MSKLRILLADDSSTVRTIVSRILNDAGHAVITAEDGIQAVDQAIEHKPDLAVLDVIMPGLDGYGVCEELQKLGSHLRELPIVFLTCVQSRALELLGKEYGAYLNKPVNGTELLATIEREMARIA